MAGIKISVDDIRAIPDEYDLLFLNPEITISELSLDHDMGIRLYGRIWPSEVYGRWWINEH